MERHPYTQSEAPANWTDLTGRMREAGIEEDTISSLVDRHMREGKSAEDARSTVELMLETRQKLHESKEAALAEETPTEVLHMGGAAVKYAARPERPRIHFEPPRPSSYEGQDLSANAIREAVRANRPPQR